MKDIELIDYCDMGQIKDILYRKETTDFNCLKEVILQKTYQLKTLNFTVERGENWIDVGGNIGAFGLWASSLGVSSVNSFEPDNDCFSIMKINYENFSTNNSKLICHNFALTTSEENELFFYKGGKDSDRYRTSIIPNKRPKITLPNKHIRFIDDLQFDCIKMDIEGSEFDIIDNNLIPKCKKFVMEYHITKDKSMANFHKRMNILRESFDVVYYMKSLDLFDKNGEYPGFFDRMVYCLNK